VTAALAILAVLLVYLRSFRMALYSIIPNLLPMVATAAVLVMSGRPLQLTTSIVFSIAIGIAVDDTVHFLNALRRHLASEASPVDAVLDSIRSVGSAIVISTILLLIGFGTLTLSSVPPIYSVGVYAGVTIFVAMLGDLYLLPSLVILFERPRKSYPVPSRYSRDEIKGT
jgi:predicted RND superfamily exporter protein